MSENSENNENSFVDPINGKTYIAVKEDDCQKCDKKLNCCQGTLLYHCCSDFRKDNQDIIWKIK